ncbi:MAG: hypothetical protein ACI9PZ_000244, partial [Parvicella sp.]
GAGMGIFHPSSLVRTEPVVQVDRQSPRLARVFPLVWLSIICP